MGIDTALITEAGDRKQEVHDSQQCLTRLATTRWPELHHTKCLQFIEPWGDTVFNQSQIPHLLAELRSETMEQQEQGVLVHLEAVIVLVERAVDEMHTYIKFIGD